MAEPARLAFRPSRKAKKGKLRRLLSIDPLLRGPLPDVPLLACVFGLLVFGWIMVYSSSALVAELKYKDQFFFLKRQILWSIIGLGGFIVAAKLPLDFWRKAARPLYAFTLVALAAVLVIGPSISGARRWIRLPGASFQPSELAKLSLVLVAADYMDRRQSRLKNFKKGLLPLLVLAGMMIGLIVMEPDLGTPMLMSSVFAALLILGGASWLHFITLGLSALPLIAVAVFKVRYRLQRLFAYLNPWADAQGKGYQLISSLLAMGSGGFFGRGLGESRLKVGNLPDCHTDFVFSILGEELGLVGTLTVAFLFLALCLRGLRISKNS
ncbi:MAG: cell division protein FtsW, partial [Elusimicrobia bacterium]|nr:cell division protein FtsW [Elusimicrobiota bacterium]